MSKVLRRPMFRGGRVDTLPSKPNILSPEKPGLYPVENSVAMFVGTPATLYKSDNIPLPINPTSLKTLPNCVLVK